MLTGLVNWTAIPFQITHSGTSAWDHLPVRCWRCRRYNHGHQGSLL